MSHDQAAENEQLYRYQITATLNAVVRACADVVSDHSHRGFWTPRTSTDQTTHQDLIEVARQDVLHRLQAAIQATETVAHTIEQDHQRQPNQPTE